MVSKVNGIKIYPKRSLGSILSGSICVFLGLMILFCLTLFPIIGATINGVVMQANAIDYAHNVLANSFLKINFLESFAKGTHFFASSKYNSDLFNYLSSFKEATNIGNAAVGWYTQNSISDVFDYILAFGYITLCILALFIFVEGIIRLATGTYPYISRRLTVVAFFVLTLFVISSFITNFCTKYIAKEVLGDGDIYIAKTCPLQYILWIILLICWIAQYWINVLFIKGKLYVADAALIRKNKNKEEKIEIKKSRKSKKNETVVEETVVEPQPIEENVEAPANVNNQAKASVNENAQDDIPIEENKQQEVKEEESNQNNNAENEKKE
ncbi:MAG: hypothetical protein K6E21_01625 [Bacilli bacterium]|nr:hypothetical protein [Bacilli bacterium]